MKKNQQDVLAALLQSAPVNTLRKLLIQLSITRPDIRLESFDYLKSIEQEIL